MEGVGVSSVRGSVDVNQGLKTRFCNDSRDVNFSRGDSYAFCQIEDQVQ